MTKKRLQDTQKRKKTGFVAYKKVRKYATILGINIDGTEPAEVLKHISGLIETGRKFLVVTPNPEIVMKAQGDTVLSGILNSADISLPDGVGLVWASRYQALRSRLPLRERVSGVDVMEKLVKLASERDWRVFLLGGRPGVAAEAAHNLKIKNEKLKFKTESGPLLNTDGKPINEEEIENEKTAMQKINAFHPHILFVGFGAPKQEKWASRLLRRLEVNCVMVVGGAFDYISGRVPRAPGWVQKAGLEWLFRLFIEPWRIKRQFALLKFAWLVITKG